MAPSTAIPMSLRAFIMNLQFQSITERTDETVKPLAPLSPFPRHPSETELRPEHERVLRLARPVGIVVEDRPFEIECVSEVLREVPIQTGSPGFDFPAGTGRRQAQREGAIVDTQGVVPRGQLKCTEVAVAEIEVRTRAYANARIGRAFSRQHEGT